MIDRVLQVFLDILHFIKFLNICGCGLKIMFALKDKKNSKQDRMDSKSVWCKSLCIGGCGCYLLSTPAGGG